MTPRIPLAARLWPRFDDPAEEARFRAGQAEEAGRRIAVYAPMAIGFVLAAGIGHVLLFPRFVWQPILLLLTATMLLPLLGSWWLARHNAPAQRLQQAMRLTALGAAVGVCLVVASARAQGYPLPYEGILLVTMTVFLLSGLPARDAMLIALTCLAGLVVIEWTWPTSRQDTVVRTFFGAASWLLGSVFSLLIERADRRDFRHREQLHDIAVRDPLTGLLNRRGLDERFALLQANARRDGTPVSLAVIDLDHFKAYNDTLGHEAGDAVLAAVAGVLMRHARRPLDIAARLGGEEFLLAWQDTGVVDARRLAADVITAVRALDIPHPANNGRVTASLGHTTLPRVGADDTLDALYRRADAALYRAKHAGRDRAISDMDQDQGPT